MIHLCVYFLGPPPGGYITDPPTYQAHTGSISNNPSGQPIAVNEETASADPPAKQPQGYDKPQNIQPSYPNKNANTQSDATEKPIFPSNAKPLYPNRQGNGQPLYPSGQNPVPQYPKQPMNPQSQIPNQSPNNPSGSNPQPQYPKQHQTPNNNDHPLYPSGANPIPQYPKQPMKPKQSNPNQIPAKPMKPNSYPGFPPLPPKYPDHGGKRPNVNPGSLPDICKDSSIDAVTRTADGNSFAFKGKKDAFDFSSSVTAFTNYLW